jgi:uridine phosphorylase
VILTLGKKRGRRRTITTRLREDEDITSMTEFKSWAHFFHEETRDTLTSRGI